MKQNASHLINTFVMMLMIGLTYAWSVFVRPLEMTFGWTRTQTSLVVTLLLMSYSIGNILTGIVAKYTGYKTASYTGSILICAGLAGAAFSTQFTLFAFCYGIISGTGIGMLYHTAIAVTPPWFPGKKGMATGMLVMGYALSASVLGPLCQFLLSRHSVRNTLLILAGMEAVVLLGCSMRLEICPSQASDSASSDPDRNYRKKGFAEMILSVDFWCYYGVGVLWYLVGTSVMNHGPVALQGDLGMEAAQAALVLSAMNIVCGVMRPVVGCIHDRIGLYFSLYIGGILFIAGTIGGWVALVFGNTALFILGVFCVMGGLAFLGTMHSIGTRELFGEINFSRIYPILCTNAIPASFGTVLVGGLQNATGNYVVSFAVLVGISMVPFVLTLILGSKHRVQCYCKDFLTKQLNSRIEDGGKGQYGILQIK